MHHAAIRLRSSRNSDSADVAGRGGCVTMTNMSGNPTEFQSQQEQARARRLSLQRTKPPGTAAGYDIQRFLGAGAYGEVWVGTDRNTGRRVAIKFYLHRGGLDWRLLSHEVEKLVFLSADRYVVQLLDVGWDAEPPFYVMEYVENGSLDDWLRDRGRLPPDQAVSLFRDVAVGLSHAHGKGVLHCDLKPANILLDQDHRPRLADFGQSRLSHDQTPALGTLFYMAPEQADLEAVPDARWDVYALGAMLYCMLTGEPPYRDPARVARIDAARDLPAAWNAIAAKLPPPARPNSTASCPVSTGHSRTSSISAWRSTPKRAIPTSKPCSMRWMPASKRGSADPCCCWAWSAPPCCC
jgi:serine/threonine protein kinase